MTGPTTTTPDSPSATARPGLPVARRGWSKPGSTGRDSAAQRIRDLASALGLDRRIVVAFGVSRLLIVLAAVMAENVLPRNPALTSGDGAPILRSLTSWDGWYYLGIAREGYHLEPVVGGYRDIAFPPLYPALVRVLAVPWPDLTGLVAVLLSNVLFLLALGQLATLGKRVVGADNASRAAALMAIYPFASVFAMAYTESLFLLLTVGAFLAAERDRRPLAGLLLALASITRLQGAALILPLGLLLLRRDGWRPKPSLAWLLLGPVAALAFLVWVGLITGSGTAFLDAQQAWGREGIGGAPPGGTIAAKLTPYQLALLLTLCWSVFMFVFRRGSGVRAEYLLVPVLYIAAELSSGTLEAVGRVTMAAFPYVWLLASPRSRAWRLAWPAVSVALFMAIALLSFGGYWVP